jgi:CRISPR type III-B/RAMP module-associated protein Cmr5
MATRDQQRATLAWQHIETVKGLQRANQKRYGTVVHGLPALIRNAGLSQALHFVFSRNDNEAQRVLGHLAEQLAAIDPAIRNAQVKQDALLKAARESEVGHYLRLTQEALACITWYKRLVKGVLGVDASEDEE